MKKYIRFEWCKRPKCESLWEFGAHLTYAEYSVSGYKLMFIFSIGVGDLYVSLFEVRDEEEG